MSDFERADQEVMGVVNGHAAPEATAAAEEILRCCAPQDDGQGFAQHCAGGKPAAGKETGVCEEELAEMERVWRRRKNRRTVAVAAASMLVAGMLLVVLAMPELLVWLVNLGILSCGVTVGIALDRWLRWWR